MLKKIKTSTMLKIVHYFAPKIFNNQFNVKKNMKSVFTTILLLMGLSAWTAFSQAPTQTGTVTVKVTNIDDDEGNIRIGMFTNQENFSNGVLFKKGKVKADEKGVVYTFTDVPVGTYMISVFHDENSNEVFDKNFMGIPSEDYGFSQNKFGFMGPPKFEDVKFELKAGQQLILEIKLK